MIRKLITLFILFIALTMGIHWYLAPDDLAVCEAEKACSKVDAIVVISGGDTDARTDEAVKLYKNGLSERLVVAGAAADKTGPSNAEMMRQRALAKSVPAEAIIQEVNSETTRQNAENVAKLVRKNDWKSIILVTSGYHMRRAMMAFSAQLDGVAIYAHPAMSDWSNLWWITPWGWATAVSELVKIGLLMIGVAR